MMKTTILILATAVALTRCGKFEQLTAHYTGQPARVCVAGVTYLQFTSGATVMVDKDGKPVACVA